MERTFVVITTLIFLALACNFGTTSPPTAEPIEGQYPRCGDGVCYGPENADNCLDDCAVGEAAGTPGVSEITPVYVTVGTHIENKLPLPCGDTRTDRCCSEYERFRSNLITYADLFLEYGVEWNLQTNDGYFYYASDYINQLMVYIEDGTAESDKMYTLCASMRRSILWRNGLTCC